MISVIVPAHNEELVLPRLLRSLLDGGGPADMEIVVVCNGCTDHSAAVARAMPGPIHVIETDVASKPHALNLGDATASGFPRFYVDADVVLRGSDVAATVRAMEQTGVLAAAPAVVHNLSACSRPVRAFYAIDARLPSARHGIGGSGVYVLSREGRGRFDAFPPLTADDAFVRHLFRPHERLRVEAARSIVTPPRTLRGLIAIKTRTHLGNYELRQKMPHLMAETPAGNGRALLSLARNPAEWARLLVYLGVKALARVRAHRRLAANDMRWERDESSRQATALTLP